MSILEKMMTALKGGVNEAGEAIVDSQALRILDQEVREATEELKLSKQGLVAIIAHQKVAEEKAAKLHKDVTEYEGYALKALEKGDEPLAREVAEKIAGLENEVEMEQESARAYALQAEKLKGAIKLAEANIKRLKQQVDTVKATESVQRAQQTVAARHAGSNSRLRTAMDSLERIKEKQSMNEAKMSAAAGLAEDMTDASLQERLHKAGITKGAVRAEDILARLKNKK
jgi:phage shock protein A